MEIHTVQGAIYDIVAKDKVPAFISLMDSMSERLGSMRAVCEFAGVHQSRWVYVARGEKNLSIDMAKKILEAHKKLKEAA